ncbi:MAG: hypothetical protein HQL42_16300, partial [Alphaproteobacteria bacterium]|nr:hypothetical protein [Alphaproteobacteria bacterium]
MADENKDAPETGSLSNEQKLDTQILDDLTALRDTLPDGEERAVEHRDAEQSVGDNSDLANVQSSFRENEIAALADGGGEALLGRGAQFGIDPFGARAPIDPIEVGSDGQQQPVPPTDIPPAQFGANLPNQPEPGPTPEDRFPEVTPTPEPAAEDRDDQPAPTQPAPSVAPPQATTPPTTEAPVTTTEAVTTTQPVTTTETVTTTQPVTTTETVTTTQPVTTTEAVTTTQPVTTTETVTTTQPVTTTE